MERLIVPVYLNQKIVFDLLAMLQGGISTVTSVTASSSNKKSGSEKMSARFGLSEAFSTLIKIDFSGSKDKSTGDEQSSSSSQERVHTPASLFFQLRNLLLDKKYLKEPLGNELPKAGDFVEFEGFLKRNPIVETIDSLVAVMGVAESFKDNAQSKKGSRASSRPSEDKKIKEKMTHFSNSLKAGNTIDLTSESLKGGCTAVVTVDVGFLSDPLMSDLVDGQFKIIGKVIKSVNDESDSIDLLRKTAFSKMSPEIMSKVLGGLSSLGKDQGFNIPELKMEIKGPAIQILPIAIYA